MSAAEIAAAECARFGAPGAAVSVVAHGEVVLAEGFGRRDDRDPVTSSTLFMLASDTKCFAAATLCQLAEDGLLDLDAPVQDHLPWFAMHDERVSGWVTPRDLLAHRTGLPRHALMTVGNGDHRVTNEDLTRRMRYLQASRPFRQGFGYNNVHYAAAGHVCEVITGRPWRELLDERVLAPLGMTATSTYRPEQTRGDFAAPHVAGTRLPFQTRDYDLPSGGMVTNADDLCHWLLARLGGGLLSPELLRTLHAPVVPGEDLPFPELLAMGYALGNTAFAYRGRRLQLHGGSQIGFASQVMVLPDDGIGVAVLVNDYGSRLPLALGLSLLDEALGLDPVGWGERLAPGPVPPPAAAPQPPPPPHDLPSCEGTYRHPAYGEFSVAVVDGGLRASFHGLDDELVMTHAGQQDWLLSVTSVPGFTVPVTFGPGEVALALEPELDPLVFVRA